jgi:hypothetical protein
MRTAYSGRAAAYEAKGEVDLALTDLNMLVVYYGVELDVLDGLEAPDRAGVMTEAGEAYRSRARLLTAKGLTKSAKADTDRADKLQADAKKLTAAAAKNPPASGDPDELKRQVADLQKKLNDLRDELRRTGKTEAAAGENGQIEVSNRWTNAVTVVIDGVAYPVGPGEVRRITRAAGSFNYEVRDVQARVTRQLKAGETYTIRIEPP